MPPKSPQKAPFPGSWTAAAHLVARWLDLNERLDVLMDGLPREVSGSDRSRCQHLVYGVVRHHGRIQSALSTLIAHPPRFITRAVLHVAAFELLDALEEGQQSERNAKIVHHAVERTKELASPAEARLVNAVVRRLADLLGAQQAPGAVAKASVLADYFSHPDWLVARWLRTFGAAPTRKLLEWNQAPAPLYGRWRDPQSEAPEWMPKTEWEGFHAVLPGHWAEVEELIAAGKLYIQDPSTRLGVGLLAPKAGESVLDVCAAPGGKSLAIADRMGEGRIVSMDLPSARIDRLKENLARTGRVEAALVQADILTDATEVLKLHKLPLEYDAVLIDVPCSNTGVMRHRIDVKWRLQERDFAKHARQQLALLSAAARRVAKGGRIVYSTCSIEAEENEQVVKAFLASHKAFELKNSAVSFPWMDRHDGAGAFLLSRI